MTATAEYTETYHIRRPLRRAGGNQFYRDRSDRGMGTYCGAPEGHADVPAKAKAPRWTRESDGVTFEPCEDCAARRRAERP